MNIELWREFIQALRNNLGDFMHDKQYAPLDELGGERHGSWVWTCVRQQSPTDQLTRYVSLALTPEIETGPVSMYLIEVSVGADDSMRYKKIITNSYRYGAFPSILDAVPSAAKSFMEAMITLDRLSFNNLDESYLPVRPLRS